MNSFKPRSTTRPAAGRCSPSTASLRPRSVTPRSASGAATSDHKVKNEDRLEIQRSCGRQGCSSPGKHPWVRRGLHEATTDEAQITEWWRRWPHANVAIATGERSGIVVIDIDLPRALPSLDVLIHKLPRTLTALTGGGGIHLVYGISSSVGPRSSAATSLDGTPEAPKTSNPISARGSIYRGVRKPASFLGSDPDFDPAIGPLPSRSQSPQGNRPKTESLRCTSARVPGISGDLPGIDLRANGGCVTT
jgi:hypothetical protein